MIVWLFVKTLLLWPLLSALCIYAWRSLDSFMTQRGHWA